MPNFIFFFIILWAFLRAYAYIKAKKIMGKLIVDGKSVYEIDEECLKKRKVPTGCKVEEALKKQREQQTDSQHRIK